MRTPARRRAAGPLFALVGAFLLAACAATDPAPSGADGDGVAAPGEMKITIKGDDNTSKTELRKAAGDALIVLARERKAYQADDAAFAMEEYLREEGYHRARVDYELVGSPPAEAIFRLSEGPRAVIDDLSLVGRGNVSRHRLSNFFAGNRTAWIGGETLYVEARVETAVRTVRAWYRTEGYLDAEVSPPEVSFNEAGTRATVRVVIDAGICYFIRSIRFEGPGGLDRAALRKALGKPLGIPFTRAWARWAEKRLGAALRDRAFWKPAVEAVPEVDPDSGAVSVLFRIAPGVKRTVGTIAFAGQERTEESFLRSLLYLKEGAPFHGGRLRETGKRLYGTGLFDRVDIDETAAGDDGAIAGGGDRGNRDRADGDGSDGSDGSGAAVDILFTVEEREPYDLSFLGGYGSYEMLRGAVTFSDRNIFGKGLRWTSGLKASMKGLRGETGLTDHAFLDMPLAATVSAYADRRVFPSFLQEDAGAVASVSKRGGPLLSTIGYSWEQSSTVDADPGLSGTRFADRARLGSVFLSWVIDTRDSGVKPRRGSMNEVKVETADALLGGDLDFNRITGRSSWIFPLDETEEWILACGVRAGVILRGGETDVIPLQHRFFNGGENSVRSFREHELGPKLAGEALGGEFFSTVNVELRAPLHENLGASLFVDGGNVRENRRDIGFDDYRYALGLGLRYELPIGPIRLDWGWNPDKRDGEDLWVLHLGVGYAF